MKIIYISIGLLRYSEEAQMICPHEKVRRSGYRAKAKRKEKSIPRGAFQPSLWSKIVSLASFAFALRNDELASTYETPSGSNKLSHKLIEAAPSKKTRGRKVQSLVSYDEDFVRKLPTIDHILADATFDSVPRIPGVYQLLTIMTFVNGKVSFHSFLKLILAFTFHGKSHLVVIFKSL